MPALAKGGNSANFRGNFKKSSVKNLTELGVCHDFTQLESCQEFEGIDCIQTLNQLTDDITEGGGLTELFSSS